MRPFLIFRVAAIFAFFLAFISPVRTAANVTSEKVSCPEGKIKRIGNAVGCIIPLKVRPPGHGGGANPNDAGMCGVLNVSANFGTQTVARIIVDSSGYYAVELLAATTKFIPILNVTCVLFSDFKGVPPDSEGISTGPPYPQYNGGSAGGSENIKGSALNACIWAGLSGNLQTPNMNQVGGTDGAFGNAFARFIGSENAIGSQNVISYAFCSGYTSASWKGWNYVTNKSDLSTFAHVTPLSFTDANDWCYMDGIEAHLLYPTYSVGVINAGLSLSGGKYSVFATPAGGVLVEFNCLPLQQ
jgi:hypothetical protein